MTEPANVEEPFTLADAKQWNTAAKIQLDEARAEIERLRAQLACASDGLTSLHREADGLAAENDRQHAVIEQLRADVQRLLRNVEVKDGVIVKVRAILGTPDNAALIRHASTVRAELATAREELEVLKRHVLASQESDVDPNPEWIADGDLFGTGAAGDSTADETPVPVSYDAHERAMTEVMEERDRAIEWADRLAAALAPADVVGEHSNANEPWVNALEWAEGKDLTRPASSVRDTPETARYFVGPDAFDDTILWRGTGPDDPNCRVVASKGELDGLDWVLWSAAVKQLTGQDVAPDTAGGAS